MIEKIIRIMSTRQKTLLVFTYDFVVITITLFLAYAMRYNKFEIDAKIFPVIVSKSFIIVPVQLICFYLLGLYKGIWRFSSTPDLVRIIKAVSVATPTSFIALFLLQQLDGLPRSILLIQWTMLLIGVGGGRFAYRLYRDVLAENMGKIKSHERNTLILGAGYSAQTLIRDIKNNSNSNIRIVGLLDDDVDKRRKILHGFKVLGGVADIAQVSKVHNVTDVIIAIPSATKDQLNRIIKYCNDTQLKVKTIPRLSDLLSGKVQITKLRKVTPSDLLGRDQVDLNMKSLSHMISDKIVIVTGAGGSIGSELCNQIAKFKPKKLICYDISEYNLYELGFNLSQYSNHTSIEYIIGDVRDATKAEFIFEQFRPNIAFHAAAYKHVPMMELNPFEAIKVNVFGTQIFAKLADKYKLEKFVLVSTDKAVNPTNVMGTTKRIAEMICQSTQENSNTIFAVVRFGNVLGSSGSVIPLFQKQIESGGPVTVTHPDIIRYFMSIPEAAQLVIQAGSIGKGGEIFILDMGSPIKITDLAKQMITLAGYTNGDDIEIEFTGLRPGEKLYEELLADNEETLPTAHERVRVGKVRKPMENLHEKISQLLDESQNSCIRTRLKGIVPEYDIPKDLVNDNVIETYENKLS